MWLAKLVYSHPREFLTVVTHNLDDYILFRNTLGQPVLYSKSKSHNQSIVLPKKYHHIQTMEELKIRLDMEGNHVGS